VGRVAGHPNQRLALAGSEHLGGNGVDIVGEIRQEARFRQHCGGDGSRVVVCWHPGSRHPASHCGSSSFQPARVSVAGSPGRRCARPGRTGSRFRPYAGRSGRCAWRRAHKRLGHIHDGPLPARPRARRAGCRAQQPGLRRSVQVADHRGPLQQPPAALRSTALNPPLAGEHLAAVRHQDVIVVGRITRPRRGVTGTGVDQRRGRVRRRPRPCQPPPTRNSRSNLSIVASVLA
jgi:hypothetical protein